MNPALFILGYRRLQLVRARSYHVRYPLLFAEDYFLINKLQGLVSEVMYGALVSYGRLLRRHLS